MRVLIYEFITGGGLIDAPLPPSLQREGAMMRDALLADVMALPDVAVVVTRDRRCPWHSSDRTIHCIEPRDGESGLALFKRAVDVADVVWPIAPDSELIRLAQIVRAAGKRAILSDEKTLALCASKFATARGLYDAGVSVVPTFRAATEVGERSGQWISKPDNGSGGEGIRLWPNIDAALQAYLLESKEPRVFQPWCPGESLSLSLLCEDGSAVLLAVNRQHIVWHDGRPTLEAISVNACDGEEFHPFAQQIARAVPGLWGYIGVDLIRAASGQLSALEINPRLTTSYCGLRRALNINVAAILLRHERINFPHVVPFADHRTVTLNLNNRNGPE